jgi:hypothetical protein
MEKEALKRIFEFLEEKEKKSHKDKGRLLWKIVFNEPLTKEDLNVKGGLFLYETNITSLPEGLKVGGVLDLRNSSIEILPKGLEVGDELDIGFTDIKTLPQGLKVGGVLNIIETDLLKYSNKELKEMIKPGFIKGKIIRESY